MKKSLIALAVLAISGAAFAQVSLTGKLGFSYQKNATPAGGAANHGMAMTDGDLNFAATEDLGGGTKVTAKSAFASRGRDNTFGARDASLSLNAAGSEYVFGSIEKCNRIDNVAGAPVSLASGHDSGAATPLDFGTFTLDGSCHFVDTVGTTAPIGPVTLGVSYNEAGAPAAAGRGRKGDLTYTTLSLDGAFGALSLGVEVRGARSTEGGAAQTYNDGLMTTRFTAAYDFGGPVLGLGFQNGNHDSPNQTTLSVAVPFGAAKVGLIHSARAGTSAASQFGAAEAISATAVGMDYSLSKQTTFNASYGTYSNSAANGNEYRLRLMKAF